jgi:hypothetical protein
MNEYFKERDIKSNVKKLKDVFDIISLTTKYKVIGSSNLRNIRYNSDFDLADFYENSKPSTDKIVKYFQFIYKTLDSKDSYSFITDFKCGLNTDGEALKWTKQEVIKNKKLLLDGYSITLNEAIQEKSTIKIDVISYINNTFIEISENYYIKIGNIVLIQIDVVYTTVTNFGTGQYSLTLPFASKFHTDVYGGSAHDTSPTLTHYSLKGHLTPGTVGLSLWQHAGSSADAPMKYNVPFNATTVDKFHMSFSYICE